jgi:hypothetical protein
MMSSIKHFVFINTYLNETCREVLRDVNSPPPNLVLLFK